MKKVDVIPFPRRYFLFIGVICLLITVGFRFYWESRDKDVLAVMSPEDIALLAHVSGTPESQWQALFGDYNSFTWNPEDGSIPRKPVALIENEDRTGMYLPDNYSLEDETSYGAAKAFYLYHKQYGRMAYLDDAQRVEDLLFRAVTDRGMRLLILTPMTDAEGTYVTDIQVWQEMLDSLQKRLEDRGYTWGLRFSCLRNQKVSRSFLIGGGLLPMFAGLWLLCSFPPFKKWNMPLSILGMAALLALCCLLPAFTQKLLMLATAIVFPCCAGRSIALYTSRDDDCPLWQSILLFTAALPGWSLLSGLAVAALMSTGQYMLGVTIFSGVKLSLLLPMAFGCLLLLWNLRKPLLQTGWKGWLGLAFAGAVLGAAALVLAARSGDIAGGISQLETNFRNWLEYTLYVRPRTKEMLAAVPCIP
ncbi:MAG: hypothetical protein J6J51_01530, partial [Clostridia bacterium]|nr:hypothetical protein [Clostridia bacterium]